MKDEQRNGEPGGPGEPGEAGTATQGGRGGGGGRGGDSAKQAGAGGGGGRGGDAHAAMPVVIADAPPIVRYVRTQVFLLTVLAAELAILILQICS